MDEKQLDELLERKKSMFVKFERDEADFSSEFFSNINSHPPLVLHFWRYAAGFLLVAGLTLFFMQTNHSSHRTSAESSFVKVNEAARVFGGDTAVLFFRDELVTGRRDSAAKMGNYVDVQISSGNSKIELSLVCADNDSIYLEGPVYSGNVIISRSDDSTLVLDMDLSIQGTKTRAVIPVVCRKNGHYSGRPLS